MRYDLKHLSTFVAVAEELNFHRAAERLTMAQPAVSRVVLELEDRLGVKLLERTTRKVRLTESGRYLLEEAQEILSRIDMAENTVRLLASGTKAILRIGYTTITGHSLVPDITREFRLSNPDVRLELTYLTSPAQRDKILQDEIDLGFIEGSFQSSEIETRPVARHRLVALLPPSHPLAAKNALTIEDLAGEQLVMGTNAEWPTFRRIVVDAFQTRGTGAQRRAGGVEPDRHSRPGDRRRRHHASFPACRAFAARTPLRSRPVVTDPPVIVETHLAWRRASISGAMRRFIETSQKVGKSYML